MEKRLIDANVIDMDEMDFHTGQTRAMACEAAQDVVDAQPTVDAEPVSHAHWVFGSDGYGNDHYYCSFCLNDALNDDDGEWCLSHYCPHCGARMDGGADNGSD